MAHKTAYLPKVVLAKEVFVASYAPPFYGVDEGMSTMNWKMISLGLVSVLTIGASTMFFVLGLHQEVHIIKDETSIPGFKLTPEKALEIATPHMEEHGTFDWSKERPLKTYVAVLRSWFGDRYYIKRTNYPFKTHRYILHDAVIVHPQTGEVSFSKHP